MNISEKISQTFNHQSLLNIWILVAFLFIVAFILKSFLKFSQPKYEFSGQLFSKAEHSFFMTLQHAIGNDFEIFAKVRILDILEPDKKISRSRYQSAFNKISSKHFDYVLCAKDTLRILAVIELDDKSHELLNVQRRDIFLQNICESVGLKLLRFKCKTGYNSDNIRSQILASLNSEASLKHHSEPTLKH